MMRLQRCTTPLVLGLAVVALALGGTLTGAIRTAEAGHVVSPMLTESSPATWWEKNRESVLGSAQPDVYTVDSTTTLAPEDIDPLATSRATSTLASLSVTDSMVEWLRAEAARGSDATFAGKMREFLALAADLTTHSSAMLAEMFRDDDGELEREYEELMVLLELPQGTELLAQLRASPPAADERASRYLDRLKRELSDKGREVRKGIDALEEVAQRLARLARGYAVALADLDQQFSAVRVPTTGVEMQDFLYLLRNRLLTWKPDLVSEDEQAGIIAQLELNVATYIAERRDAGRYPSSPWPGLVEAATDRLDGPSKVAVQVMLRDTLGELATSKLRHSSNYNEAWPKLRSLATFMSVLSTSAARLIPPTRDRFTRSGSSIRKAAVDALMVIRFVSSGNDSIVHNYYSSSQVMPGSANSTILFSCEEETAVLDARRILAELAGYKPTVVAPLLERALADERARVENGGTLTREDMVFTERWSTKYTTFKWDVHRDYARTIETIFEVATGSELARRSGVVGRLTDLPKPRANGSVITD